MFLTLIRLDFHHASKHKSYEFTDCLLILVLCYINILSVKQV